MPSVSNTARIGPPAMMPVPGGAERRKTLPAPWRPSTSWCNVLPSRSGTRTSARLAASVALRIASGTSRALPWPKPTRPFWSPATTRAAKPKRRPPFTTLATRLMWTSLSTRPPSRSSRPPRSRPRPRSRRSRCSAILHRPLELQSTLAGGVGERLDAPVIEIAAAIEDDRLHALGDGALGHELAHRFRGVDIGAGLEAAAHVLLHARRRNHGLALQVIDDLGVDVLRRAEDRQPRPRHALAAERPAHPAGTARDLFGSSAHDVPYFFLPSLRKMNSPAYFTPLPL